jgi:GTP-dependent dephospho-CoA kinase
MRRLPEEHRGAFQAPYGRLYPSIDAARHVLEGRAVLSVGDVVTAGLLAKGVVPAVAVVDGFTARNVPVPAVEVPGARTLRVQNPAATLTDELEAAVRDGLARPPALIVVDGEEDLAVIPLALAAPDNAALVYGQPGQGVVVATIDPERRALARALLDLFVEE